MEKTIKSVRVPEQMREDIDYRTKHLNFNLSEWFRSTYEREFMSASAMDFQIRKREEEIEELKTRKKKHEAYIDAMSKIITKEERRYLIQTMGIVRNGGDLKTMWLGFNKNYGKGWDYNDFRVMAEKMDNGKY